VLFCDLVDSTKLGEHLDPESLRELMRTYFDSMSEIIQRHGGTIEKFIGDAIMAVFGIPVIHEDDALRGVRAAFEMREATEALNRELQSRWGVAIFTRTGVNTGPVVAGEGDETLVTGDTVNVAARLEQVSATSEITIGEITFALTKDAIEAESIPPLTLKGKGAPVAAHRLLAVRPHAEGHARRMDSPIVGRQAELAALREVLESAVASDDARCRSVTLLGHPGVGKSRLAEEVINSAGTRWVVLRGRCLPYGEGITFWPLLEAVREAVGITESDDAEMATAKLAVLAGGDETVAMQVAQVVGIREAEAPAHELFGAVRTFFMSLAARRPLLLLFDDIHWGEPTFLDLIEHLTRWTSGVPMVLVCTARPTLLEERPEWGVLSDAPLTLTLDPLPAAEASTLVDNLLGQTNLAPATRTRITEAAAGNPLFVEELLGMLVDTGALELVDGHWSGTADLDKLAIPPTVAAILDARIEQLGNAERADAERGSIQGLVFSIDALVALSPADVQHDIAEHLDTLQRTELIEPDHTDAMTGETFRFRHELIRDAVYGATLKGVRADLHERFANWLEEIAGARVREVEEILGYHLEQAYRLRIEIGVAQERDRDLGIRAATVLARAGRRALDLVDMPAAVNLLDRAARLSEVDSVQRARLLAALGEALLDTGAFDAAGEVLEEADRYAREHQDAHLRAWTAIALADLGGMVDPEGWSERAEHAVEEALPIFGGAQDDRGLARAYAMRSFVLLYRGASGPAAEAAWKAYRAAQRAGSYPGRHLSVYASALLYGPVPVRDAQASIDALLARPDLGEAARASALEALGVLHAMRGDFGDARDLIRSGALIDRQLGREVVGTMAAAEMLAEVELRAGDPAAAEEELRQGFEALEALGERGYASTLAGMRSRVLCALGRWDEAATMGDTGQRWADSDDLVSQVLWRGGRARVLAHAGNLEEANALARAGVALAATTDHTTMHADALTDLAGVLEAADDASGAAQAREQARELLRGKGDEAGLARL